MSLKGLCATIVSVCAVSAAFLLFAPDAEAAFSACQCSCIDPDNAVTLLRAPQGSAAENEAVCRSACEGSGHAYIDWELRVAENRLACTCQNIEPNIEYQALTPGRSDCSADCAQACGGAAFVDPTQDQSTNIRQVDCIRDDDCTVGEFRYFQDVSCTLFPTSDPNFPEGEPRCVVPPTRENADIECQQFGGLASGGNAKCVFISQGENVNASYITRPYLSGTGQYVTDNFNTYTSVEALWNALESNGLLLEQPGGNQPGLCYLYGKNLGFDYSEIDIGEFIADVGAEIGESAFGIGTGADAPEASRKYICAKPKTNSCGVFDAPAGTNPVIKPRTSYSCTPESQVTNRAEQCFPDSWSGRAADGTPVEAEDLCVTPGTLCCAGLQGCTSDAECGPYKQCVEGDCEWRSVCDTGNPERRCRSATAAEKVNPDFCSPEFVVESAPDRCPISGQACCEAPDEAARSSCAADLSTNTEFAQAGDGNDWRDYLCVTTSDIPDFGGSAGEWVTLPDGSRRLKSWQNGGNCVTSDVPAGGEIGGAAISRCGTGRVCCDPEAIGLQERVAELEERPEEGFNCPRNTASIMTCKDPDLLVASWQLGQRGFPSIYSYLEALASSGYCRVTPLASGSYTVNEECENGTVCCTNDVIGANFCANDTTCPAGQRCDQYVKLCVDAEVIDQKFASEGCVDRAEAAGDTSGSVVVPASGSTREAFACQLVDSTIAATSGSCLQLGCEALNAETAGSRSDGQIFRCCAPGIGQAPAAAAENVENPPDVTRAAGSIGLPSCISTGLCTLDDIVYTGAQFANFLIGLSGSVFLAIFIYAGFMYLTAAGSSRAETARKMIIQSTIGIVLMLAGFVIISFIQSALISSSAGETGAVQCGRTEETAGMSCTFLQADPNDDKAISEEISDRGCVRGLCPGPTNHVCCPS